MLKNQRVLSLLTSLVYYLLITIPLLLIGILSMNISFQYIISISVFLPLLVIYFSPQILVPILKAKPYNGTYKKKVIDILNEHGVGRTKIYSFKKSSFGAIAMSFGPNASIFIREDQFKLPFNQCKMVIMHEVAHHKYKDQVYSFAGLSTLFLVYGTYLISQITSVVDVIMIVTASSVVYFPIILFIMRLKERKADRFAYTQDPNAWISLCKKAIAHAEKKGIIIPKKISFLEELFHTHPWIYSRLEAAKVYLKDK